uniref:Uncharacterized protein n=1 Tax=Cacopsylla melanoneura TaxID=428564 RepID=A0A8D9E838_9HEMI
MLIYKLLSAVFLTTGLMISVYKLWSFDTVSLHVTRTINAALQSTALLNTVVVDVYGQNTTMVDGICNFRIALIRPYNWLWINMDYKIYRLIDTGLLTNGGQSPCLDHDSSTFVRLNDPRTGVCASTNMKTICLPFTRSSLVAYFSATKRVIRTHLSVCTDKFVNKEGKLNELTIVNFLLENRLFIIDRTTNSA